MFVVLFFLDVAIYLSLYLRYIGACLCVRINYIHINLTLQRTTKNSLSRAGFELASSGFETAALPIELSSQLGLVASLIQFKCTKYFRAIGSSVKSSRKYFVHLNWIRLATNPSWLDNSIGRAPVQKPEYASSNPARDNEFFVVLCSVRLI